jgi:hypothetical protein
MKNAFVLVCLLLLTVLAAALSADAQELTKEDVSSAVISACHKTTLLQLLGETYERHICSI